MENIVVGTDTYIPYVNPTGLRDTAVWRLSVTGVPPLFFPTITHTAVLNKAKTNVNASIQVEVPIPVENATTGLWSAPNKIKASAQFTSLQAIADDVHHILALDSLIAALNARRDELLASKTN